MILFGIFVSTLLWVDLGNLYVWAVMFVMLGFGGATLTLLGYVAPTLIHL